MGKQELLASQASGPSSSAGLVGDGEQPEREEEKSEQLKSCLESTHENGATKDPRWESGPNPRSAWGLLCSLRCHVGREFTKIGLMFIIMKEIYDPSEQMQNIF